jgi:hypothetical protein
LRPGNLAVIINGENKNYRPRPTPRDIMNYFRQNTANLPYFLLLALAMSPLLGLGGLGLGGLGLGGQPCMAVEYLSGIQWPEPAAVTPGTQGSPPSDAVVLLGKNQDLSVWEGGEKWNFQDGIATVGEGPIQTKQKFGDCQLHIEWSSPKPAHGQGQNRGNSGIFLMGIYEIQVLDSYQSKTYFDGQAGGIYKQTPPLVNAMRPPGEWNVYDIIWAAPRFAKDGSLQTPATITALHNGLLILNHFTLLGDTPYHRPPEYKQHPARGPISLQDHGHPVRFRNIWLREIRLLVGQQVRKPYLRDGDKETPIN